MARNLRIAPAGPLPTLDDEPQPARAMGPSDAAALDSAQRPPPPQSPDASPSAQALPEHRLGQILVELGCLRLDQVEAVLLQQVQQQRRFGDLAVALGLVARSDIDLALARQFDVDFLPANDAPAAEGFAQASDRRHDEVLRAVRSQLLLRWFGPAPEQRTLAVLSPGRGEGRSHLCAGLGRLLAQLDEDTLLIDADLRKPGLHTSFGMDNRVGLAQYLRREVARAPIRAVPGHGRLHLLPAGQAGPEAQALVERRDFAMLLGTLARRYAFVLIDTPPAGEYSESLTAAVRSSGCLLVSRRHRTRLADAKRLADQLAQHGVEVQGAVLNDR